MGRPYLGSPAVHPVPGPAIWLSAPDPSWSAPERRRPAWLPLLVCSLVVALVGGGVWAAERVGSGGEPSSARFAPADGTAVYARRQVSEAGDAGPLERLTTATTVTEHARYLGANALSALDWTLATRVLGLISARLDRVVIWRALTAVVDRPAGAGQELALYELGDDITMLAESADGRSVVYTPGLVVLAHAARPGDRWRGAGTTADGGRYESAFAVVAGDGDCLRVSGSVTLRGAAAPDRTLTGTRTWCPGRGIVASEVAEDGASSGSRRRLSDVAVAAPALVPPPASGADLRWTSPAAWRARSFEAQTEDPTFGPGPVGGTPSPVAAVSTSSGIVFRVSQQAGDLLGFVPKTADAWLLAVRAHPGGTILTATAYGRLVLVTTSERRLVAYSDAGVRLWTLRLADLVTAAPVRLDDRTIAVGSLTGELVTVELGTGAVRWRNQVGAELLGSPVPAGDAVVVVDRSGAATAYGAADGARRWSVELAASSAAPAGGLLIAATDQTIEGLDPSSGRRRWLKPFRGTFRRIVAVGDRAVLFTSTETLAVGADGTVQRLLRPYQSSLVAGGHVFGWGDGVVDVYDSALAPVTSWPGQQQTVGSATLTAVPYQQGIVVVGGSGWQLVTRSDEP